MNDDWHGLTSVLPPFGSITLSHVESGTVIRDEKTGDEGIVTDQCAIRRCGVIYCTRAVYEKIRKRVESATPADLAAETGYDPGRDM